MIDYHDHEWGVVQRDDQTLFEALLLEGAQAGLSWRTILNKREGYRAAFAGFSPTLMAAFTEADQLRLQSNSAIVRHRGKIEAFVNNARAYLMLAEKGIVFSDFVWQFVGAEARRNRWQKVEQLPAKTPESLAMSKALKKVGFKFVGPTTCYAFMQSVGMVNDHLQCCFCYDEIGDQ